MVRANRQVFWVYYKDAQNVVLKGDQGFADEGVWRVSPEGVYCAKWKVVRKGAEACWNNARLEGKMLRLSGMNGVDDSVSELLPGNPQGF
jgi:hypothetical protein